MQAFLGFFSGLDWKMTETGGKIVQCFLGETVVSIPFFFMRYDNWWVY